VGGPTRGAARQGLWLGAWQAPGGAAQAGRAARPRRASGSARRPGGRRQERALTRGRAGAGRAGAGGPRTAWARGRMQRRATAAWQHTSDTGAGVEPRTRRHWSGWRRRAWWRSRRGAEAHAAQACAGVARQGRNERGSGSRKRRSSCANVQGDGVQSRDSRFRKSLTDYGGGAEEAGAQWCMLVSYSTECP
jgi:hypothetical protein